MQNHIVIDSGCDMTPSFMEQEDIGISYVPLNLQIEDQVYVDDENLNLDSYLAHMESSTQAVKTSAPSPTQFLDRFKMGDNVFVVTLSSKLSATYQSAITAKNMYIEEYGKKFIHVFDSLTASVGGGNIALRLAELIKKNIPAAEVVTQMESFIKNAGTFFILDKFDNLVKTGRINPYVAKIASFLNVKPVCRNFDGEIKMIDKARGYKKAVVRLIESVREATPDIETRIANITHVKALDKALELKDAVLSALNVRDCFIHEPRGITTTYANRGGVVLGI